MCGLEVEVLTALRVDRRARVEPKTMSSKIFHSHRNRNKKNGTKGIICEENSLELNTMSPSATGKIRRNDTIWMIITRKMILTI